MLRTPPITQRKSAVAALTVVTTLTAASVTLAAGGNGTNGFQPYKDARLGFALAKPIGWQVKTSEQSITVEAPDKSELLLTEMFHAAPGETAAQWLDKLSYKYGALFPQAHLDNVTQQHTKGDEIIAALHYQGPHGAAQLRALCSIVGGKGLLYVMAAPADRFAAERPKLIHVAQSLVFTVPKGNGTTSGGGTSTASQIAAATHSMQWVKWTDPREHAFSVSVPEGWKMQGGAFRAGQTDMRLAFSATSPDNEIAIRMGDPGLGTFTGPSAISMQTHQMEGQNGILHYMRAPEFSNFYLHKIAAQGLEDLQLGQPQEFAEDSRQATEMANRQSGGMSDHEVSVGLTPFSAIDKGTHKPIEGLIYVVTQRGTMHMGGMQSTTWTANPELVTFVGGDATRAARALATWRHLEESFRIDSAWNARRTGEINQATGVAMAKTAARSQQIAANSAAAENAIMGRYESHRAAQDNQQRGFINYIGDRTDVTDGDGHTANVGSGMSHYYRNERTGTIMGTNSAYSPGVDFTPMTEY